MMWSYLLGTLSPVSHNGLHRGSNKLQCVSKVFCTQVIKPQILNNNNNKISPDTNLPKTKHTQILNTTFSKN